MASFVHSFRHHGKDHIAKEFRKLKRQKPHIFSSQPRVWSDIRANFITAYSLYLLSDDPEMSLFNILNSVFYLFVLFIYLSYIFILYSYLFIFIHLFVIFRRPPSVIRRPFPRFTDTQDDKRNFPLSELSEFTGHAWRSIAVSEDSHQMKIFLKLAAYCSFSWSPSKDATMSTFSVFSGFSSLFVEI